MSEELKGQLARRARGGVATGGKTVYDLLERQRGQIERALPKHLSADRLLRTVMTTVRMQPELLECTPESLLGAIMLAAQLGLEPGPLGHVYFVPFFNSRRKVKEVQFIPGYRGLMDLAYRSGHYSDIDAHTVYANDAFEYEYGTNERLIHRPAPGDRGEPIYWYAIAFPVSGGKPKFRVMNRSDIEARRKHSRAGESGPWLTHYDAMAKKTVLRALHTYLRLSAEARVALAADETVTTSIAPLEELQFGPVPEPEDAVDVQPVVAHEAAEDGGDASR